MKTTKVRSHYRRIGVRGHYRKIKKRRNKEHCRKFRKSKWGLEVIPNCPRCRGFMAENIFLDRWICLFCGYGTYEESLKKSK